MGAQYFILKKMIFCSKISEYQCFAVCCPKPSFCASKPSKLPCKLVISFVRIERGSDGGPMTLKSTWCFFLLENQGISMYRGLLHRN